MWKVATELEAVRDQLAVADAQLAQFVDDEDEARLRAIVADTPSARAEHRDAEKSVTTMRRHRDSLRFRLDRLERQHAGLLDRLLGEPHDHGEP